MIEFGACGLCHPAYFTNRVFGETREHTVISIWFVIVGSISQLRWIFDLQRWGFIPASAAIGSASFSAGGVFLTNGSSSPNKLAEKRSRTSA